MPDDRNRQIQLVISLYVIIIVDIISAQDCSKVSNTDTA